MILGYLLTPSLEIRPDIFQVSFLAFKLAGKKNPVQNLNVSYFLINQKIIILCYDFIERQLISALKWPLQKVPEPNFDNISLNPDGSNVEKATAEHSNSQVSSKSFAVDSGAKSLVASSGSHLITPAASGIYLQPQNKNR